MISITCPVCRGAAGDVLAVCHACETPHHPECWEFARGCAVFACGEDRARLMAAPDLALRLAEAGDQALFLDESTPEPAAFERPLPAREMARLSRGRVRESNPVLGVSWFYLAASLVLAIPTTGYAVRALTGGGPDPLARGVAAGLLAMGLKTLGDLLAVGDGRGRTAHLYLCLVLGLFSVSLPVTACLLAAALPFWTRRGREHFGRFVD